MVYPNILNKIALLCVCALPAGAIAAGATKSDDVVGRALRMSSAGCVSDQSESGVPQCPGAVVLVQDLLELGEYQAAGHLCRALQGKASLPSEALSGCAGAESRLGNLSTASTYLRLMVDNAVSVFEKLDANIAAANVLTANARYSAAYPFLKEALHLAGAHRREDVSDLLRKLFVNRLDSGVQAEAVDIAGKIAALDSNSGNLFVIQQFLSHDKPELAVRVADVMLVAGVRTTEEMGVLVSCYARMNLAAKAVDAAASCLKLCDDVDTGAASSVLLRNALATEAAAFAESNRASFKDPGMVDFETGRLWLAAGDKDKAFDRLLKWAKSTGPVPASKQHGMRIGSRYDYAAGFLLENGSPELVIKLTESGRLDGMRSSDELSFFLVRALCLKNDWTLAERAADDAVANAGAGESLRLKLATLFYDFNRYEAAVRMLGTLADRVSGEGVSVYSRDAWILLLKARLVSRGALTGDIDAELIKALEIAAADPVIVNEISRFAGSIQAGVDLTIAVAESVAAVRQDDPAAMKTLAGVYLSRGLTMAAAEALELYVDASEDKEKALTEGLDRLLADRLYNEALWLVGSRAVGRKLAPSIAVRIGEACLEVGERSCVTPYFETFFSGPVSDDYDYVAVAERLASAGFYDLTEKALNVARRVSSAEGLWREALMRGRLNLFRGDRPAAEKAYLVALKEAPSRARILTAIGADYAGVGDIVGALNWVGMGISDKADQVRSAVFATWADTMRRLDRASDVTIKPVENIKFQSFVELKDSLDILVDVGRADLALKLLDGVRGTLPAREKGDVLSRRLDLLCAVKDRSGAVAAAEAVCNWSIAADGAGCADACGRLIDAGYRSDGLAILKKASARGLNEATITLVLQSLAENDVATAEKAALKAAEVVADPVSFVRRLWAQYPTVAGRAAWVKVLDVLMARPEFSANPTLIVESGVSSMSATGGKDGLDMVRRFANMEKGNVVGAFKALVSAGWFDQARLLLAEASPASLADMKSDDLAAVIDAFQVRGMRAEAEAFVDRFITGCDDSAVARAELASALLSLGDIGGSLKQFVAVSGSGLNPEYRFDYGVALWKSGDRKGAMQQFLTVIPAEGNGSAKARARTSRASSRQRQTGDESSTDMMVLAFLDSENAVPEMAEFLDAVGTVSGARGRLLYSIARVHAALPGDEHLKKARSAIFEALKGARYLTLRVLGGEHDDVIEYARIEARRGTAGTLAAEALEHKGAAFAQLAMYSACLAGDNETLRAAVSRIVPVASQNTVTGDSADASDLLIAAKLMFECGRWNDSADFAMRYLGSSAVKVETVSIGVSIAAQSFAAAGKKSLLTPEYLARLTSDEVVRSGIATVAAATAGDNASEAASRDRGARLVRQNVGVVLEAFDARVRVPGGDIVGYAGELQGLLAWPDRENEKFYSRMAGAFRFDDASEYLRKLDVSRSGTVSGMLNMFRADIDTGNSEGALATAGRLAGVLPDPSRTLAGLMGYASAAMRRDVVVGLASMVLKDTTGRFKVSLDSDLIPAVIGASWFLHQTGPDGDQGRRLLVASHAWARDPELFCATLVSNLPHYHDLTDRAFISSVHSVFDSGVCASLDLTNALSDFDSFLTGGPAVLENARSSMSSADRVRLMTVAGRAAVVQGRYDDAYGWYKTAADNATSRAGMVAIVSDMVNYLGDQSAVPADQRARMAEMGLRLVSGDDSVIDDGRYAPLVVQLMEMSDGMSAAVKYMDSEIRLDPSSAVSHNNLAYVLSIRTADRKRFQSEIRLALALSGADRGSYMDTEAWGVFQYGNRRAAMKIQTDASALWSSSGRSGLAECFNHYGMILEEAGNLKDAVEMYRRSVVYGDSWDWHSILSLRKLRFHNFFNGGAGR